MTYIINNYQGGKIMDSFEPKKSALIRILQVLQTYSDSSHPLTYKEIEKKLDSNYNIVVERKAIGRNIALLQDVGYDIVTTKKGSYLNSRLFEDSELKLLVDGVLSSRHISVVHSKHLIEKLASLSNKYFKSNIKNVCSVNEWNKTENKNLFYNIEIIDEAIEKNRQIKFDYNKYQMDKKLHKTATHIVSPYQMILHNQKYYLMAYHEKWKKVQYFQMDRITGIDITDMVTTDIRSIAGYENGIDYKKFSSALPYMFSDEPEVITFAIDGEWLLDQVIDWLGFDFRLDNKDNKLLVTVKASPHAMEYWFMQYMNFVEVISPLSLRKKIISNIEYAAQKYNLKKELN